MGAHIIQDKLEDIDMNNRIAELEEAKTDVLKLLKQNVRPEFLNRIDETVMFTPLNIDEVRKIVKLQIGALKTMLTKKGINLQVSDQVISHLAEVGFEPQFGARPIKRVIQREVLNALSKEILSGKLTSNSRISIDFKEGELVFEN